MSDADGARRAIQRDWLGHGIQLVFVFMGIGLPLFAWASSVNTTIAKMEERTAHQDQQIAESRAALRQITDQMLDVNRQLATIVERVSSIRENLPKRR